MVEVLDASKDNVQYIQNTFMPTSIYEGYPDYTPDSAPLFREIASKIIVGELKKDVWDKYVKDWYDKGGRVVTQRSTEWYKKARNIK